LAVLFIASSSQIIKGAIGGWFIEGVLRCQISAASTVTFSVIKHHHHLASTKLCSLVNDLAKVVMWQWMLSSQSWSHIWF